MNTSPFISSEFVIQRNHIIDTHRQLILEIRRLEEEISKLVAASNSHWRELENQRSALVRQIEPLIKQYWEWIPPVRLSRCPFCQEDLTRLFDPVDLNGFWWMDRTQRPVTEPESCGHFRLSAFAEDHGLCPWMNAKKFLLRRDVRRGGKALSNSLADNPLRFDSRSESAGGNLERYHGLARGAPFLGAVNFNGLAPQGGLFECRPGPDVPYVIPRILEMPTMEVVISSIPMHCGYTAYPICYYSQKPPAERSLTQSWARKEYRFTLKDERSGRRRRASPLAGWDIIDDVYDFDLLAWLEKGKMRWYNEGKLSSEGADPQTCPFLKLKGKAKPQILRHDELSYEQAMNAVRSASKDQGEKKWIQNKK